MAHRDFVDQLPGPGRCTLDGELAHHLGRVLRVRAGETVVLGDGRGGTSVASVAAVDREQVVVDVAPKRAEPPAKARLLLAFACPRLPRTEWLFEHGTEVGVAVFQPLRTERARQQAERPERWRRVVRAAAGQCDRAWLPEVREALDLPALLAHPGLPPSRVLASAGAPPMAAAAGDVALLVGPEGGFTDAELAAIAAAGFVPRSCGPHILRSETAALVGAAILLAH